MPTRNEVVTRNPDGVQVDLPCCVWVCVAVLHDMQTSGSFTIRQSDQPKANEEPFSLTKQLDQCDIPARATHDSRVGLPAL